MTEPLEPLTLAKHLNASQSHARYMLEPWIATSALARLGSRRLSQEEQKKILQATRTPHRHRAAGPVGCRPEDRAGNSAGRRGRRCRCPHPCAGSFPKLRPGVPVLPIRLRLSIASRLCSDQDAKQRRRCPGLAQDR